VTLQPDFSRNLEKKVRVVIDGFSDRLRLDLDGISFSESSKKMECYRVHGHSSVES
jgi:hypothetical protein